MIDLVVRFIFLNPLMKVKTSDTTITFGEFGQFLGTYLKQVENLLGFVSSCRSINFEDFLIELESMIKYFFARDQLNYARLMPVNPRSDERA